MSSPTLPLNSGFSIPLVGLGTWQSSPGDVKAAVKAAVKCGYRAIDCALAYGNEKEIGEAFKELFDEGIVKREDLFVTSKLWCTFHSHAKVKEALLLTLDSLGLSYLDLYLIHYPMGFQEGGDLFPCNSEGQVIPSDIDYLETWKAMEELPDMGLVRSIGVSNFNVKQLTRLLENCRVKPAMHQIEIHPFYPNKELVAFSQSHGIAVTAYGSLGAPNVPDFVTKKKLNLLTDERVRKIAEKHGRGTNHVLLRFALEQNICIIPKSANEDRIKDNLKLFDFTLDEDDMKVLSNFEESFMIYTMKDCGLCKYHPFFNDL